MTQLARLDVRENGLVATLVKPPGGGSYPAVLCIGGSSGGVSLEMAEPLAREGFAALALGYFGVDGLPPEFAELPLEYFERAVTWLLSQQYVAGNTIGVTGTSRGSEAALQTATLSSGVGAAVAYVPSGIRWMGVGGKSSWRHGGKPLPYMQWPNDFDGKDGARAKVDRFNQVLDNPKAVASAEIAVEKAHCPILLISGKDDQLWPSERMANLIMERLKEHYYPYEYRHIAYPNAGHRIKVPGLDDSRYEPVSEDTVTHEILSLGGTLAGNRVASERAFTEAVAFLRESLK
jgi:dienelactone hydrolase